MEGLDCRYRAAVLAAHGITQWVVFSDDNAGDGDLGVICNSLDEARQKVIACLQSPDRRRAINPEVIECARRDLVGYDGTYPTSVRGDDGWKEWVYIVPLEPQI